MTPSAAKKAKQEQAGKVLMLMTAVIRVSVVRHTEVSMSHRTWKECEGISSWVLNRCLQLAAVHGTLPSAECLSSQATQLSKDNKGKYVYYLTFMTNEESEN